MPQDRRPVFTMQKVNWRVSLPVFLTPAGFLSFITQVRQFADPCCLFSCNYLCGATPAAVFSHDSSCLCMIAFKRHSCRNPRRCRCEIWGFQILSFFAPSVSPSLLPPSRLLIIFDRGHFKVDPWNRSLTVSIIAARRRVFHHLPLLLWKSQNTYF